MRKLLVLWVGAALMLSLKPLSGQVPTTDSAAIAQAAQALEVARQNYESAIEQIGKLQEQIDNISGLSDVDVSLPSFEYDLSSFPLYESLENFSSDGNAIGYDVLNDTFTFESLGAMRSSDNPVAQSHVASLDRYAADYSFGSLAAEMSDVMRERAQEFMSESGQQQTLKEAIDFNTRLQAEIAYNQAQQLALLAALLKQQSFSLISEAEGVNQTLLTGTTWD